LAGADRGTIVPDEYFPVKGGTMPIPPAGVIFSGAAGRTLEAAACAVPHGQLRFTTVAAVRAAGATVRWRPELSRNRTLNRKPVNIAEVEPTAFSELMPNPVPSRQRIDGNQP
jgi:hypothetical protein